MRPATSEMQTDAEQVRFIGMDSIRRRIMEAANDDNDDSQSMVLAIGILVDDETGMCAVATHRILAARPASGDGDGGDDDLVRFSGVAKAICEKPQARVVMCRN